MATGMPVITNDTSTSPVVHGENGFRSDDPEILREGVRQLLESPDLAREMGEEARATVLRDFGISAFIKRWQDVVNTAVQTQT